MIRIIVYAGLSIPFDEAKEILDSTDEVEVVYKRPIQRGDLGQALKEHPDIIAIIDGVFHQSSAVGHKEILNAMKNGVKVYGASSMGALRASELDTLGMTGAGYVYNQYATGEVDSDDEDDEKEELLKTAKKTYYPKRNYAKTLNDSSLDDAEKSELIDFIRTSPDIKKEDAKELLNLIKEEIN